MNKSATAIRHQRLVAGEARIRPWCCTDRDAIYCPIHHDCTCGIDFLLHPLPSCPLHGADTSHPTAVEVIR